MKNKHPPLLYYSLFLIFLATTSLMAPSHGALGKCNPSDYKALMSVKKSVITPNDDLLSWIPNTDCCDWDGVGCDSKNNRIYYINTFNGDSSGQISSSIGDLVYLVSLVFNRFSNISGPIPQSISKLKRLIRLDLGNMRLSGPIPNFLNQLTSLTWLDLSNNQLSGSIPPNLSELKHMEIIHLHGNKLTGSIPESFGEFTGIRYLTLFGNKLTGSIPKSLGAIDFNQIDLSRNQLVGDASMLFNPNHGSTSDIRIDLSWNQLEFDLTKVKFPRNLTFLDISHNKIFGGIPEEIKGLEDLYALNVSYNRLCGKIPTGGIMQRFSSTSFYHNKCLE